MKNLKQVSKCLRTIRERYTVLDWLRSGLSCCLTREHYRIRKRIANYPTWEERSNYISLLPAFYQYHLIQYISQHQPSLPRSKLKYSPKQLIQSYLSTIYEEEEEEEEDKEMLNNNDTP